MENKLNNIQNDKLLIQLYNRIVSLRNTLEETDDIDLAISEIMTFMEKSFHIPMFEKDVSLWIMKNEKRNKFILHIYQTLSNLRTF